MLLFPRADQSLPPTNPYAQYGRNPPACAPYLTAAHAPYGYRPSLAAGIIFCILFGVSGFWHLYQIFKSRAWWCLFFVMGAGIEVLGWIARTKSYDCPYSDDLFTMQVALTIMGPAWTQAGIYCTLWVLLTILGRKLSPVPPKVYLIGTACADIICLTLQATGGGLAGSAFDKGRDPQPGTTTMVVGIIVQLVLACVFTVFLAIVVYRGRVAIRASAPLKMVVAASTISITCMIIRGVYRSIELLEGWRGPIITTERYFIGLDAITQVAALHVFNVLNPGLLFGRAKAAAAVGELPIAEAERRHGEVEKTPRPELRAKGSGSESDSASN